MKIKFRKTICFSIILFLLLTGLGKASAFHNLHPSFFTMIPKDGISYETEKSMTFSSEYTDEVISIAEEAKDLLLSYNDLSSEFLRIKGAALLKLPSLLSILSLDSITIYLPDYHDLVVHYIHNLDGKKRTFCS